MQMIDRVGSVLHAALLPEAPPWDTLTPAERSPYLDLAIKAIQAMRMPSEAMLAEGARHDLPGDAANVWERMIYRALRE